MKCSEMMLIYAANQLVVSLSEWRESSCRAFLGIGKIGKCVFCIRKTAGESYCKKRWIMIDNLGIGKGCKIC